MIGGLKSYPAYKDSLSACGHAQAGGVPWLGKVPEHWEVRRLRQVALMLVSNVDKHTKKNEVPIRLCNYQDVYKNEQITSGVKFMRATATPDEIKRFRLRRGDVAITKDSETWTDIGVPALIEYEAPDLVYGYHLAILRPYYNQLVGKYLLRALQSQGVATQLHVAANGVTRFGLSHNAIKNVQIPVPPLPEQTAIVRFLDWAEGRIQRVIRARERRIELLEEYKQALIHQAVTGKIDVRMGKPYLKYKQSGVEWLGEVPEHWKIVRNGRLFTQRNETGFSELPILEVSLKTGIQVRDLEYGGRKQMMSDRAKYKHAVAGDIAYNMMRMWQGAVGVVPTDGLVSPAYVVARPRHTASALYFASLFRTVGYMREIDRYSRGIVKDRNRLYWEDFKRIPSACPPRNEQDRIAGWIDDIEVGTANLVKATRHSIDLFNEFRTRLIADVVTGKLDVREAAAKLPESTYDDVVAQTSDVDINGGNLDSSDEYATHKQGNAYGH